MTLKVMSGVDDGTEIELGTKNGDGKPANDKWTLSIGRRDEHDIVLRNDTYVSRHHANLHWRDRAWWLEDCNSTNGTFISNYENFFEDQPVKGFIHLSEGQLFRVGRTWLQIQE